MEKQSQTNSNYQDKHWLDIAEMAAVAASVGGSIASIFLEKAIFASAPLTACVALNLMNRKRLLSLATTANNNTIAALSQQNQKNSQNLGEQITQVQEIAQSRQTQYETDYENLSKQLIRLDDKSNKGIQELQSQCDELVIRTKSLSQIQSTAQYSAGESGNSAESYCKNGNAYEKLGEKQRAIEEYSQAIKIDARCAEAHLKRGLLYSEAGNNKAAVEDLRKAAKFFFEEGDLDSYQKTKNMSQNIHQLNSNREVQKPNQVLANSLFS